jgi:predicted O-methyltransferase YrrM
MKNGLTGPTRTATSLASTSGSSALLSPEVTAAFSAVDGVFDSCFGLREDKALEHALKTSTEAGLPEINVAPNQGKMLHLLAKIRGAESILEIGTLGGYSTIWLARALPSGKGKVITLEYSPHHAEVAKKNFERAGVADRIEVRVGAALDTLPQLQKEGLTFDFVFIDADKPNNPHYLDWTVKLARKGCVIVGDNVVRGGKIADPAIVATDENTEGSKKMLEVAGSDKRVSATAVQTVGSKGWDGFMLAIVQ